MAVDDDLGAIAEAREVAARAHSQLRAADVPGALSLYEVALAPLASARSKAALELRDAIELDKTLALRRAGRLAEALPVARRIFNNPLTSEPAVSAKAGYLSMLLAYELERWADAYAAGRQLVERHGKDPRLAATMAEALYVMSASAGKAGYNTKLELQALQELIHRFSGAQDERPRLFVALALLRAGAILVAMGQVPEALTLWDELIERFGARPPRKDPTIAIRALCVRMDCVARLGEVDTVVADALRLRDLLVFDVQDEKVVTQAANAVLSAGEILARIGRDQAALGLYTMIIEGLGRSNQEELRASAARARIRAGLTLARVGQFQEAMSMLKAATEDHGAALRALDLERAGNGVPKDLRNAFDAWALVMTALMAHEDGDDGEAARTFEDVIARFGNSSDAFVRALVKVASDGLAALR